MSGADDAILSEFVEACKERFKDNLVCIFHHGSYARREAVPERSDVDTMIILRTIDREELKMLRQILSNFPRFQAFLLSLEAGKPSQGKSSPIFCGKKSSLWPG